MKNKLLIIVPVCTFIITVVIFRSVSFYEIPLVCSAVTYLLCYSATNKDYSRIEKILAITGIISCICGLLFMIKGLTFYFLLTIFGLIITLDLHVIIDTFMDLPLFDRTIGILGIILFVISIILLLTFCKMRKIKKQEIQK